MAAYFVAWSASSINSTIACRVALCAKKPAKRVLLKVAENDIHRLQMLLSKRCRLVSSSAVGDSSSTTL